MPTIDPRIDAYLAAAPAFAQPILQHLRAAVHAACPEVTETLKWSRPHFMLNGQLLCGMSAFKAHCAFGFWTREGGLEGQRGSMGDFGRLTTVADLPALPTLQQHIRTAAGLIQAGAPRVKSAAGRARAALQMPPDFDAALTATPGARAHYDAFTPGKQREYLEWVLEAKREDTRARRIAQAVAWLAEGKTRNWKYEAG